MPSLSAGIFHCVAVVGNGRVVGWGANGSGRAVPDPELLKNRKARSVAAGELHSLAIVDEGKVVGWGRRDVRLAIPPFDRPVAAVAAGCTHSLALLSNGSVVGWGFNVYGESTPPKLKIKAIQVAAGRGWSALLLENGNLMTWGNIRPPDIPPNRKVLYITAGPSHGLAVLDDGAVIGWGDNAQAQLDPPPFGPNRQVIALAAGGQHSMALCDDGSVVCWGHPGNGRTETPEFPGRIVQIAAGGMHSVAQDENGMVHVWGYSGSGQTALPMEPMHAAPTSSSLILPKQKKKGVGTTAAVFYTRRLHLREPQRVSESGGSGGAAVVGSGVDASSGGNGKPMSSQLPLPPLESVPPHPHQQLPQGGGGGALAPAAATTAPRPTTPGMPSRVSHLHQQAVASAPPAPPAIEKGGTCGGGSRAAPGITATPPGGGGLAPPNSTPTRVVCVAPATAAGLSVMHGGGGQSQGMSGMSVHRPRLHGGGGGERNGSPLPTRKADVLGHGHHPANAAAASDAHAVPAGGSGPPSSPALKSLDLAAVQVEAEATTKEMLSKAATAAVLQGPSLTSPAKTHVACIHTHARGTSPTKSEQGGVHCLVQEEMEATKEMLSKVVPSKLATAQQVPAGGGVGAVGGASGTTPRGKRPPSASHARPLSGIPVRPRSAKAGGRLPHGTSGMAPPPASPLQPLDDMYSGPLPGSVAVSPQPTTPKMAGMHAPVQQQPHAHPQQQVTKAPRTPRAAHLHHTRHGMGGTHHYFHHAHAHAHAQMQPAVSGEDAAKGGAAAATVAVCETEINIGLEGERDAPGQRGGPPPSRVSGGGGGGSPLRPTSACVRLEQRKQYPPSFSPAPAPSNVLAMAPPRARQHLSSSLAFLAANAKKDAQCGSLFPTGLPFQPHRKLPTLPHTAVDDVMRACAAQRQAQAT